MDVLKLQENYSSEHFDAILFDAPCSGEGTINLTTDKLWPNWSLANIKKNYIIQKRIFNSIAPLLKTGGTLVYSTCTLAPEENEGMVHYILCNFPEFELQDIEFPKIE